uniref:DUF1677 family protein n=1 Tax=Kalanchoe fedtschenkoi TaxID=63787 RepID=A0A7N0UZ76_KALFE
MAPHGDQALVSANAYSITRNNFSNPSRRKSNDNLHRSISDLSFQLSKELHDTDMKERSELPPISEVEDAKCECCGMVEECTHEYIERIRGMYLGKWVCGLCSEAVKEEMLKNGGKREEALNAHVGACVKFNKYGRAYPVLFQAEAMRGILKKRASKEGMRATKSFNPRENNAPKKGSIARSSSCIPAITRDMMK